MKDLSLRNLFCKLSVALMLCLAPVVQAQEQPQAPGAEHPPMNDAQLRSFAKAYIEFEKIRAEYEPRLGAANSPQEKSLVEQEAVAKFGKALEKEALSLQQYSVLYHTVSADPGLRAKVLRLIEEERAKS